VSFAEGEFAQFFAGRLASLQHFVVLKWATLYLQIYEGIS
jgi:hypothetical protein